MANPEYNIELSKDEKSVEITVGAEKLVLSIEDAFGFAEVVSNTASLPGVRQHIDNVFDGWGGPGWTDGGTC